MPCPGLGQALRRGVCPQAGEPWAGWQQEAEWRQLSWWRGQAQGKKGRGRGWDRVAWVPVGSELPTPNSRALAPSL